MAKRDRARRIAPGHVCGECGEQASWEIPTERGIVFRCEICAGEVHGIVAVERTSDEINRLTQELREALEVFDEPLSTDVIASLLGIAEFEVDDLAERMPALVQSPDEGETWDLIRPAKLDEQQAQVVSAPLDARLLVIAGPGAGKTEVACARVADLINRGVPPPSILLVSFTRAATAEMRARVAKYASENNAELARGAQLRTLDSLAWLLQDHLPNEKVSGGYQANIERAIMLLEHFPPELETYLSTIQQVIIDEAQDVLGVRALFVRGLLHRLSPSCGITVFADPAQSIYGWSENELSGGEQVDIPPLYEDVKELGFTEIHLAGLYRTDQPALMSITRELRSLALSDDKTLTGYEQMRDQILARAGVEATHISDLVPISRETDDQFLLFRAHGELVIASSYLSDAGVPHRLRVPKMPRVVYPWLGRLLSDTTSRRLTEDEFRELWENRIVGSAFEEQFTPDDVWDSLITNAGDGRRRSTVDLHALRELVERPVPPDDFTRPWIGTKGPLLGTIHGSKGRESARVTLVIGDEQREDADYSEEKRVLYVGATRAKRKLAVARLGERTNYVASGRAFQYGHVLGSQRIEFGLAGDFDWLSPVRTDVLNEQEAHWLQEHSAKDDGPEVLGPASWRAVPEENWRVRVIDAQDQPIGLIGSVMGWDRNYLRDRLKGGHRMWTSATRQPYLHVVDFTTVARGPESSDLNELHEPYAQSGFWVAPVLKGFSEIYSHRRTR